MDELAAALNLDLAGSRLCRVKNPRDIAVIKAALEQLGWQSRPSPRARPVRQRAERARDGLRGTQSYGGQPSWRRSTSPHHGKDLGADSGQIINPDGITKTIEGKFIEGISRKL
jgi:hypothetical protein